MGGKNNKTEWRETNVRDETYVIFIISTLYSEGDVCMRCIKKDCAISLPTSFIFEHCRLVSQCNAPPITSHSFAPTPNGSRPPAHAPQSLTSDAAAVGGGQGDLNAHRVLPIPTSSSSCLCLLLAAFLFFLSVSCCLSPAVLSPSKSLAYL